MSTLPARPLFRVHASIAALDSQGRLLIVQEQKPDCYGKWNLPGGHVELGEPPALGARRETREETRLDLTVRAMLGIYQGPVSLRFVFLAECTGEDPEPGDEILAVRFAPPHEILAMPDEQLQSPEMFRAILRDLRNQLTYPLELFRAID